MDLLNQLLLIKESENIKLFKDMLFSKPFRRRPETTRSGKWEQKVIVKKNKIESENIAE